MKNILTEKINLEEGGGGYKSGLLIEQLKKFFPQPGDWQNQADDAAVYPLGKNKLVFTTDAFIVEPLFFPGGDIGKIAVCGTINDLSVMGARPLGLSLSLVIEEGFPRADLLKIMASVGRMSSLAQVPIVTGDTKVIEKGKLDKLVITTAGVGLAERIIDNSGARSGDVIIASGNLGEHTIALLSKRFGYQTAIKSDSRPLYPEMKAVGRQLNACKDPTRGGLAANIVELAAKSKIKIILEEKNLPYKKEAFALAGLLGIDIFSFASEGRFIAAVAPKNLKQVLKKLKTFNREAKVIGRAEKGRGVFLKTELGGLRPIELPRGKLIPRIC